MCEKCDKQTTVDKYLGWDRPYRWERVGDVMVRVLPTKGVSLFELSTEIGFTMWWYYVTSVSKSELV